MEEPLLNIITPCSRPGNLGRLEESLLVAMQRTEDLVLRWWVVLDMKQIGDLAVKEIPDLPIILCIPTAGDGGHGGRNRALDYISDGWVGQLDDDTTMAPEVLAALEGLFKEHPEKAIVVDANISDGRVLKAFPENMKLGKVDNHQVFLPRKLIGGLRWEEGPHNADGIFYENMFNFYPGEFLFSSAVAVRCNDLR
jgi:hypothetical protein